MMSYEADRMTGLILTDEIVAPERDVVLEERRMHCDADPSAQLTRRCTPPCSPTIPMASR